MATNGKYYRVWKIKPNQERQFIYGGYNEQRAWEVVASLKERGHNWAIEIWPPKEETNG